MDRPVKETGDLMANMYPWYYVVNLYKTIDYWLFDPLALLGYQCCRTQWGEITCYDSCGGCDPSSGCQWTTCYDDVAYTEAVVDEVYYKGEKSIVSQDL